MRPPLKSSQHHALEQVVDVLFREGQIDAGVVVDLARAREVADAAVEEHDARDRQRDRRLHVLLRVAGRRAEELVDPDPGPDAERTRHRRRHQPLVREHRLPSRGVVCGCDPPATGVDHTGAGARSTMRTLLQSHWTKWDPRKKLSLCSEAGTNVWVPCEMESGMYDSRIGAVLQRATRLLGRTGPETTDAALLDRLTHDREPAAFDELLSRHGPAVSGAGPAAGPYRCGCGGRIPGHLPRPRTRCRAGAKVRIS